ncbi:MAG: CCE_0567 family metalloprotein [Cyanobacteria bacterium]|nr:CCE_0567 family metalloprotein [Cyanobacteriota bacterium]MDW8201111.1 CCE_0567 family metalloprotein [Cyanobacteriota bacterium SKYGB_h_bin112]
MVPTSTTPTIDDLKAQIKRLTSKAGQMKMDLHDLAEGLPTDYERLIEAATETYAVYRQIDDLKQQLKQLEAN